MLRFFWLALSNFVKLHNRGIALFAPFKLNLDDKNNREPDIQFVFEAHNDRMRNEFWTGPDLVMEVGSPDNPDRDVVRKRAEYAQAGISECCIVDPRVNTIAVLKLDGATQAEHGCFKSGACAASVLLPGFEVAVAGAFEAGQKALG